MFSVRGPKLKIFAGVLAVIVLIVGVYMTFFQSRGFVKTTASITDVRFCAGAKNNGEKRETNCTKGEWFWGF